MLPLHRVGLCLSNLALTATLTGPALGQPFTPGCTLPFQAIAKMQALDNSCPIEGQGSAKSQLKNHAKNNFCATGAPVILT